MPLHRGRSVSPFDTITQNSDGVSIIETSKGRKKFSFKEPEIMGFSFRRMTLMRKPTRKLQQRSKSLQPPTTRRSCVDDGNNNSNDDNGLRNDHDADDELRSDARKKERRSADMDELESQAMRVVRTVGQAFEVCHKLSLNNPSAANNGDLHDQQQQQQQQRSDKDRIGYSGSDGGGDNDSNNRHCGDTIEDYEDEFASLHQHQQPSPLSVHKDISLLGDAEDSLLDQPCPLRLHEVTSTTTTTTNAAAAAIAALHQQQQQQQQLQHQTAITTTNATGNANSTGNTCPASPARQSPLVSSLIPDHPAMNSGGGGSNNSSASSSNNNNSVELTALKHEIQLLRERLEQQSQQTRAAVAHARLLQDQLAAETAARVEAQARTHQLLVQNKELLEHIGALVSHLREQERSSGVPLGVQSAVHNNHHHHNSHHHNNHLSSSPVAVNALGKAAANVPDIAALGQYNPMYGWDPRLSYPHYSPLEPYYPSYHTTAAAAAIQQQQRPPQQQQQPASSNIYADELRFYQAQLLDDRARNAAAALAAATAVINNYQQQQQQAYGMSQPNAMPQPYSFSSASYAQLPPTGRPRSTVHQLSTAASTLPRPSRLSRSSALSGHQQEQQQPSPSSSSSSTTLRNSMFRSRSLDRTDCSANSNSSSSSNNPLIVSYIKPLPCKCQSNCSISQSSSNKLNTNNKRNVNVNSDENSSLHDSLLSRRVSKDGIAYDGSLGCKSNDMHELTRPLVQFERTYVNRPKSKESRAVQTDAATLLSANCPMILLTAEANGRGADTTVLRIDDNVNRGNEEVGINYVGDDDDDDDSCDEDERKDCVMDLPVRRNSR